MAGRHRHGLQIRGFAVEPQIFYVRQGFRLRPEGGPKINLKSSSIDVPVFFSLRMLRPLRIYAGPVFTVMNDCKRKSGGDLIDFARVRPTLSFSAGVGYPCWAICSSTCATTVSSRARRM